MSPKPRYEHDCKECEFVCHIGGRDWFIHKHPNPNLTSVLGRYGDGPHEYLSFPAGYLGNNPDSAEAQAVYKLYNRNKITPLPTPDKHRA